MAIAPRSLVWGRERWQIQQGRRAEGNLMSYCRVGGGVVGQGEAGCAGDAAVGAVAAVAAVAGAAAAVGRAAGLFAVGLLPAGFLATFAAGSAAVSSTTTGLGLNLGGSPVTRITSSLSDSGWKPLSENVTVIGVSTGSASVQGVRQICPLDALASAPGGSDSRLTESRDGPGLRLSRLIQSGVEHAARASAPPKPSKIR
jgi:hypothetical protein